MSYTQPTQPSTKPKTGPGWLPFVAGAVALIGISAAVLYNPSTSTSAETRSTSTSVSTPHPYVVKYKLSGSATQADVTYVTPSGTSQQNDIDVPLRLKTGEDAMIFHGFSSGDFLYFSAQNQDDYGTLMCEILVDDVVIATNTSSGAYSIVTCKA